MACKDQNGNFVSADSADALGEHKQERILEEEVCISYLVHAMNIIILPLLESAHVKITYPQIDIKSEPMPLRFLNCFY